jgi:hypothetical protein
VVRIRDDRDPASATTLGELRALYERQFRAKARGPGGPGGGGTPPAGPDPGRGDPGAAGAG